MLFLFFLLLTICITLLFSRRKTAAESALLFPNKIRRFKQADISRLSNISNLTIFIGSGPGSLTCAALLAHLGYPVCVLEQHTVIGGTMHTFERKQDGMTWKFETGIHYVGKPDGLTQNIFNFIFSDHVLQNMWIKLPTIYDIVSFTHGATFQFRESYKLWKRDLYSHFPTAHRTIDTVLEGIQKASQHKSSYIFKFLPLSIATVLYKCMKKRTTCMTMTYSDWLTKNVPNKQLKMVLCAQFANYGYSPETCPFGFAASVIDHYVRDGAYYPAHGSDKLAQSFANSILEQSCDNFIFTGVTVEEICCQKGKKIVAGVKVRLRKNQFFVPCARVVSGTNVLNLTHSLLKQQPCMTQLHQLTLHEMKPDVEYIFLFIGLREKIHLPRHNIWHLPNLPTQEYLNKYMNDPWQHEEYMPVFIGSGSAKERYDGVANSLVALTFGRTAWFQSDYERKKREFELKLLRVVKQHLPNIDIAYTEIGTPLTYKKYLHTSEGEAYGVAMNCARYANIHLLHPETAIHGLYLTGQDICTFGFTGAVQAGFMTAVRIHGISFLLRILIQNKPRQQEHFL